MTKEIKGIIKGLKEEGFYIQHIDGGCIRMAKLGTEYIEDENENVIDKVVNVEKICLYKNDIEDIIEGDEFIETVVSYDYNGKSYTYNNNIKVSIYCY